MLLYVCMFTWLLWAWNIKLFTAVNLFLSLSLSLFLYQSLSLCLSLCLSLPLYKYVCVCTLPLNLQRTLSEILRLRAGGIPFEAMQRKAPWSPRPTRSNSISFPSAEKKVSEHCWKNHATSTSQNYGAMLICKTTIKRTTLRRNERLFISSYIVSIFKLF